MKNICTVYTQGSFRADSAMSRHDDTPERLNADFEGYLGDMKPYLLKHPNRTGKKSLAPDTKVVHNFM